MVVLFACECIKRVSDSFQNANVLRKTPIANHFIYLGNKEVYCLISVLFSTKCCLFHNCIFYVQIHFSNHFNNRSYTTCNMF